MLFAGILQQDWNVKIIQQETDDFLSRIREF